MFELEMKKVYKRTWQLNDELKVEKEIEDLKGCIEEGSGTKNFGGVEILRSWDERYCIFSKSYEFWRKYL